MALAATTLHEAIVAYLLSAAPGSGVPPAGIVWKTTASGPGSPYYKIVPNPPPPFPYVVFDVPPSQFGRSPDGGEGMNTEGAREDLYADVSIKVVGEEASLPSSLWSPYVQNSVIWLMDALVNKPSLLNSTNFLVNQVTPKGVELTYDLEYGPDVGKVLMAEAKYDITVLFQGPGGV